MVLVERQGGCYVDVVCDACAIMWALQLTHISPDCQSTLPWCFKVESSGCREIGCCKAQQVCGLKGHLAVFLQHQTSNIFSI